MLEKKKHLKNSIITATPFSIVVTSCIFTVRQRGSMHQSSLVMERRRVTDCQDEREEVLSLPPFSLYLRPFRLRKRRRPLFTAFTTREKTVTLFPPFCHSPALFFFFFFAFLFFFLFLFQLYALCDFRNVCSYMRIETSRVCTCVCVDWCVTYTLQQCVYMCVQAHPHNFIY